jgi:membrane protease YdiL (CAAX protease family)
LSTINSFPILDRGHSFSLIAISPSMTLESDSPQPWQSLKRIFLILVTALVGLVVVQSLINSWNEPQVANRLQLYQTDLLLQSSAWKGDGLPDDQWQMIRDGLLGKEPVTTAKKQYEQVRQDALDNLAAGSTNPAAPPLVEETQAGKPLSRRRQLALDQQQTLVHELDIRLGLIEAYQGDTAAALERWGQVRDSATATAPLVRTADTLVALWQDQQPDPDAETWLQQTLEGWFQYRALDQLYTVEFRPETRLQRQQQEQAEAQQKLVRLALVGTLPAMGAILGTGLLIWLLIQWVNQGRQSLLMKNATTGWEIPWTGETIWQVLVVGFFFVGQVVLPVVLGSLGLGLANLSSRGRAIYSMVYYLLMASGGIAVLWWSLRPFRPIPEGMFRIKLSGRGFLWGLGGYFVALPLMLLVSLLNQQIWQGQGGSNPLLQTVLEEQDPVALLVFFLTAAVAAPLFEEVLFRGFLLPSLTRVLPVWGAIVLSSFVFAAAHLSLSEVLPLTVLGMILGLVYTRSRNLLSPMVLHSAWNSVTMLGLFILGG